MGKLDGKIALIKGSDRGICHPTAKRLVNEGAQTHIGQTARFLSLD